MMVIKAKRAHVEFDLDQFCVQMITAATLYSTFISMFKLKTK